MVSAPQTTATATPEDPTQPVVIFDDVSIGFEGKPVLENISLTVSPGETRILRGPAGSGKSVLLKLVNGLIRPDSGTITVFGEEINNMREQLPDLVCVVAHLRRRRAREIDLAGGLVGDVLVRPPDKV